MLTVLSSVVVHWFGSCKQEDICWYLSFTGYSDRVSTMLDVSVTATFLPFFPSFQFGWHGCRASVHSSTTPWQHLHGVLCCLFHSNFWGRFLKSPQHIFNWTQWFVPLLQLEHIASSCTLRKALYDNFRQGNFALWLTTNISISISVLLRCILSWSQSSVSFSGFSFDESLIDFTELMCQQHWES